MAAKGSEVNSGFHSKLKPKTAVNGRCGFEDLGVIVPNTLNFSMGALPHAMMAKLKPLLVEATKQRMVCLLSFTLVTCKL